MAVPQRSKADLWFKCSGGTVVLFFVWSFLMSIIGLATVHQSFYRWLVSIACLTVVLYWILDALGAARCRRWCGWALLGLFIVFGGAVGYHKYLAQIPELSDRGVNLYEYQPFQAENKLARLKHGASFRISGEVAKLDGATGLYPLYAAFVEAVYPPGNNYSPRSGPVQCSSTNEAYDKLIAGEVDVIFCLEPSAEQSRRAEEAGVNLELTPIGKEAFVFFVNAENPLETLTSAQIRGIYSGRIVNYAEVGGENTSIRAFQRRIGSGSQTWLLHIMAGETPMDPPQADRLRGMGGIIREVADYKNFRNALGFSFLYYTTSMVGNRQIKLLAVDGVKPSRQTIADGTYPFIAALYAITARPRSQTTADLIDWILAPEGQALVEATGYIPVTPAL